MRKEGSGVWVVNLNACPIAAGWKSEHAYIDCLEATRTRVLALEEQLRRSATVCPKDGCMLWRGHSDEGIEHATADDIRRHKAQVKSLEQQLHEAKNYPRSETSEG